MQLHVVDLPDCFVKLFRETIGLTAEEFEYMTTFMRKQYLPKRFLYLTEGQVTRQKAYIAKGCTRTFTSDTNGREHILFFGFEDWWIGDIESYHTGQPGKQNIQAIEDCELICISKTDFDRLEAEIPNLLKWYEVKQKKHFYAMIQRLDEVKSLSPEQRYVNLITKHPDVFQRVPLQYIAQFLDIEPPSLSRLRKRLISK